MKARWIGISITAIAVALVIGVVVSPLELRSPLTTESTVQAEEAREIPVYVKRMFNHDELEVFEDAEIGERCRLADIGTQLKTTTTVSSLPQLTMTDASGTTILAMDLEAEWMDANDEDAMGEWISSLAEEAGDRVTPICAVVDTVTVPVSDFYTVFVDGERLQTYPEDGFPVNEFVPGIHVIYRQ